MDSSFKEKNNLLGYCQLKERDGTVVRSSLEGLNVIKVIESYINSETLFMMDVEQHHCPLLELA